jgi:hypothetical protein
MTVKPRLRPAVVLAALLALLLVTPIALFAWGSRYFSGLARRSWHSTFDGFYTRGSVRSSKYFNQGRTAGGRRKTVSPNWDLPAPKDPSTRTGNVRTDATMSRKAKQEAWERIKAHHRPRHGVGGSKIGATVAKLPTGYTTVISRGSTSYCHQGVWYAKKDEGYVVVHAPVGAHLAVLPVGHTALDVREKRYYFYAGVYYAWESARENYVVVEAPVDAMVRRIPEDAARVEKSGKTYFEYGDTIYQPVSAGGDTHYRVVKV